MRSHPKGLFIFLILADERFPDLFFGAAIKFGIAKNVIGYPVSLQGLPDDDMIVAGLRNAYFSYGIEPVDVPAINKSVSTVTDDGLPVVYLARLQWWESIAFFDNYTGSRNNIRLYDFVTINEKAKKTIRSTSLADMYARVAGICTHNLLGVHYPFLYIEWLRPSTLKRVTDSRLGLQVQELISMEDDSVPWTNFVSLLKLVSLF